MNIYEYIYIYIYLISLFELEIFVDDPDLSFSEIVARSTHVGQTCIIGQQLMNI